MSTQPVPPHPASRKRAARTLSVRMYEVGFGDCFLLLIPTEAGTNLKILIDCGSTKKGANNRDIQSMAKQVIEDVRDPDGKPRIDVLVISHRHMDHISGFTYPGWDEVEVGEVWLPWVEDPDDPRATQIRTKWTSAAIAMRQRALRALSARPDDETLLSIIDLAANALADPAALRRLTKDGFRNVRERRYLSKKQSPITRFETPVLPGVKISVLGPSCDPLAMAAMDPPKGESYLHMIETCEDEPEQFPRPFKTTAGLKPEQYQTRHPDLAARLAEDDRGKVRMYGLGIDEVIAKEYDKALNGTSLMLVFQVGQAALLFPGDAQWGTWEPLLKPGSDTSELLKKVTFYKVGHHGSFNATPRGFVDGLECGDGNKARLRAMISVTKKWSSIPKKDLVSALRLKKGCQVALSNEPEKAKQARFTVKEGSFIEAKMEY
jgi:beta-lactamase superfamily II metal-dependent hydrolase